MHQPRPHQNDFYHETNQSLAIHRRIIPCAATGFGKSLVMTMISFAATMKGKTVLVITESSKIFAQLNRDIKETLNINPDSKLKYIHKGHVHLAMAQTLARRANLVEQFAALGNNLIILNDEAHIGTATKLIEALIDFSGNTPFGQTPFLLGFTATPDARVAKHLPRLYNGIVIGKQPAWLVENGFLANYKHANKVKKGVSLDAVLKKDTKGEFTEESQERYFDAPDSIAALVKDMSDPNLPYTKAIIFTASIHSAEIVAAALNSSNLPSAVYHSKIGSTSAFRDFMQPHRSAFNICVSVGALTKGFDHPIIDLAVLFRATTSLPLNDQMIGRASRTFQNKTHFTVLDYGGNGKRHGLWNDEERRDWANMWNVTRKSKEGVAPVKECPVCSYYARATDTICPNCGHEFVKPTKSEIGELETVFVDTTVTGDKKITVTPPELIGLTVSSLSPEQLARYATAFPHKKNFAIRVAKAREQNDAGYLRTFGMAMGYKRGWAYIHTPKPEEGKINFTDILIK